MNSMGTSSNEAGQPSLKQPARKGWVRRTGLLPWLLPILAVAIVAVGLGWAGLSGPVQAQATVDYDQDNDSLIEVSNLAQLNAIRWDLDGDGSTTDTESGYAAAFPDAVSGMGCPSAGCTGYELDVDLDFDTNGNGDADAGDDYWNDGAGWEPIGNSSNLFTATFDGNGHTISNLFIDRGSTHYVGLFGYTIPPVVIRNTGLLSVNVTGATRVGGLVGRNLGSITSSYTSSYTAGSVAGTGNWIGGLAGVNYGTVTASHTSGSVTGSGQQVGGLVGRNLRSITSSYAVGSVTGGGSHVGGLVGINIDTITSSYATGSVTGWGSHVGGLVGQNDTGTITASYATGSVTGSGEQVGGLVGQNESSTITTSYATGSVTGGGDDVGGLVGDNDRGTITASHATGSVFGKGDNVGGLVGDNDSQYYRYSPGSTITASYASGYVTGGGDRVGGLVGIHKNYSTIKTSYSTGYVTGGRDVGGLIGYDAFDTTITASYWDTETSGQTTSAGGAGKTTSQLQAPTGYTGIYSSWNANIDGNAGGDKPWDFGTASQYPTMNKVAGAPKSLSAMSGDEQVTLTWATGSSILPITQYQFRGDGSGRGWQDISGSDANTTRHTVTSLTNGRSYSLQVRAVNRTGSGEASDWVTATPMGPPDQPVGLTATPDANSVILNWSAASADENITRYQFQGDSSGRGWQNIPGSDASTTSYTVTGLTNGQTYTFRVRAVNPVGPGRASGSVEATPKFLVTISVSDPTPLIRQRITLTANVESGITVASYQWDRRFGDGTWREDGPPRKSKGVEFDVNRTAVYRAVATLSTGRTVRSEPITLTWRILSRITVSNSSPAREEPVTWTAQLRGGDCSSMDYAWYQVGVNGAGSSVEGASSDTITEMFFQAEPRTYYVDVTCSDSEGDGVIYTSDRVTATATDEIWPYATITSNDDDNVVPVGTQVVLTSNLERRHPPLNWRETWERRFGNGEWREVVDKPGSARFRRTFDSPGSRTYRSSIYIIQLDDTVKSDPITVTWTD